MTFYSFIMFVLMIFIAIPEIIFSHLGLNPEKINTIFFLLAWVLLFSIVYLIVIMGSRGVKYIFRNFLKKT